MKKFAVIILILSSLAAYAQTSNNVERQLFKINALVPGVSYELGLSNNLTLNLDALLIPGGGRGLNNKTQFGVLPGFQADLRYFVNMKRRSGKGKNISGNSGNFVALMNQLYSGNAILGNLKLDNGFNYITALSYGIQRTRPKGFYWGFSVGPGLYFGDIDPQFTVFIDLKLGWVLRGKKYFNTLKIN